LKKNKTNKITNAQGEKLTGIVTNIASKVCQALVGQQIVNCVVPASLLSERSSVVVGDNVQLVPVGGEQYRLTDVLPRTNVYKRGDRRSPGQEIIVAANVDCLLVVVTADYMVHQAGFIESALISAKRAGMATAIFVSKLDLVGTSAQAIIQEKLKPYQEIAEAVCVGSSLEYCEELVKSLRSKTTIVIGDRGCGKSTLIKSIVANLQGAPLGKDKLPSTHATSYYSDLVDTNLIDTPGIRDLALSNVTAEERSFAFPEITGLSAECQFRSCTHIHEAGCKVLDELRQGRLRRERYDAYQSTIEPVAKQKKVDKEPVNDVDYRHTGCQESFYCKKCGELVTPFGAGTEHRNHCPKCLASVHVDNRPGDRASLCHGLMEPVSVWVRKGGEWAVIHRCKECGELSSNRIAADDNAMLLMSLAVRPLSMPPFPLHTLASHE